MLSNTTIEQINYIKDLDYEYNVKLAILGIAFCYSLFFLWLDYKWDKDKYYAKMIKVWIFRLPSYVFIAFLPMFIIFLLRTLSWTELYLILWIYYSYVLFILFWAGMVGGWEVMLELLGIKLKPSTMKTKYKF